MKTIVEIDFDAGRILGGADAILGPSQCGNDVAKRKEYTIDNYFEKRSGTEVELTLEATDERVSKVLALLAIHGKEPWVRRRDVYTEDELQAAPLLKLVVEWNTNRPGGDTTYDMSNACPRCGTGAQQSSPLIIDGKDLEKVEKFRVADDSDGKVLLRDIDVERLLAAHVTGALFWPVCDKTKTGDLVELRRQQIFPQHVMPPMSLKSSLDRENVCPDCQRGWFTHVRDCPPRYAYRRADLANIQDFNLTWEWFGAPPDPDPPEWLRDAMKLVEGTGSPAPSGHPRVLVTPKVMNLLRGKTKKEAKHQGCRFVPIWIEE